MFSRVCGLFGDKIKQLLNAIKSALSEFRYIDAGYYRRKKFSFLKDSVSYYARITEDFEIENALKREIERIFKVKRKENNLCLLLFVYMDEIDEREKKDIKELGKDQIIVQYF